MLREVTYRDQTYTHRSVLRLMKAVGHDNQHVTVDYGNADWYCLICSPRTQSLCATGKSLWDALSKVVKSMPDEQLKRLDG